MARNDSPSKRQQYVEALFAREDARFKLIWSSAPESLRAIQLSAEEGKLIYMLLRMHNSRKVLELGTLVGYSTIWILKALAEQGQVTSVEKNKTHYAIAQRNLKLEIETGKLQLLNMDAMDYLASPDIEATCFDAIFIDANKVAYPDYLKLTYNLLRPGGLLIADNVFLWDSVFDQEIPVDEKIRTAMQEFNFNLANEALFESTVLPTKEGLAIAIKRI